KLEVSKLNALYQQKFSKVTKRQFITFHSAFNYLAADFNLEIVATIEEFPGKTPSSKYLHHVVEEIIVHQVKILFKEPQLSEEIVSSLASDYEAKVYTLDPLGGVPGRETYLELMKYNLETIYLALTEE